MVIGGLTIATGIMVAYMVATAKPGEPFDPEKEYKAFLCLNDLLDTPENRKMFFDSLYRE